MNKLMLASLLIASAALAKEPLDYVNPLIGTDGVGGEYAGMFPGVCKPFASLQWVAMTRVSEIGSTSYNYSDRSLIGFIGTRQPAIWMGDWGQLSFMPETSDAPDPNYATRGLPFSHTDETATPWFYKVSCAAPGGRIAVEMTGSEHAGLFRIQAPAGKPLHLVFDASRDFIDGLADLRPATGRIEILPGNRALRGWNRDYMDALHTYELPNFKAHFTVTFSRPFDSFGTCEPIGPAASGKYQTLRAVPGRREAEANRVGGYVTFAPNAEPLIVRIGVSLIGPAEAETNLAAELPPERGFDGATADARAAWSNALSRLTIETPDEAVKTIFYTGLYHALLYPREISEQGRYYSAFDDRVHAGTSYTSFSMWDTYRAEHALLTLVAPERVDSMMTALLQDYREGGWLPMWPNPGYTGIMAGGPAEVILAEAWAKGFRGFDLALAYEAVRKNATQPQPNDATCDWHDRGCFGRTPETRGGLSWYMRLGYVPCDEVRESVSRTLDFAFDDSAAASLARAAGHPADAAYFEARSKSYTNLWCHERGLFLPRRADGSFTSLTNGGDYCETTAATSLWCVPHDAPGAAALLGGIPAYERKLDTYFADLFFKPDGRGNLSIHGNEPSHHVGYLYNAIGKPWKTQRQVREIMHRCYTADFRGFDGNEDCGQMSAWYILSAIGIYPLNPASGWYEIGSPIVEGATLHIGKPYPPATLTIRVKNQSPANVYVREVTLNGKPLQMRISQAQLVAGGLLEFEMSQTPPGIVVRPDAGNVK